MDKSKTGSTERQDQIQMTADMKTAMAGREAPENEWVGCIGKIG